MATIHIVQDEADALIAMEKHAVDDAAITFPAAGQRIEIPLLSADKRENFQLNITRTQIKLTKATYQTRARKVIILVRLDLDGPPHRNPDDEEVPCPHLHVYREGFGDKWAIPAPPDLRGVTDLSATFEAFMTYCNVRTRPNIQRGLFS